MQLLAGLASDAAGLLWELGAMHDTGDAATDMLAKSEQLQVCSASFAAVASMAVYGCCVCLKLLRSQCVKAVLTLKTQSHPVFQVVAQLSTRLKAARPHQIDGTAGTAERHDQ